MCFFFLFFLFASGLPEERDGIQMKYHNAIPDVHDVHCDQTLLRVLGTVKNNAGIGINVVVVSGEFASGNPFHFSFP